MKISNKFLILNISIASFFILSTILSFGLLKGIHLVTLNLNHIKYNNVFLQNVTEFESSKTIDLAILEQNILSIKNQPSECLASINIFEASILKLIGTYHALKLCEKDIDDANIALNAIQQYKKGLLSHAVFIKSLKDAITAFRENSENFEKPVKKTVTLIFSSFLFFFVFLGSIILILIILITKGIKSDYDKMQTMSCNIQRLASFPEKNLNPILELDRSYSVIFANAAFFNKFNHFIHKDKLKSYSCENLYIQVQRVFEDQNTITFEEKFDNTHYIFRLDYVRFDDFESVRIFGHDVTDLKQAQQDLLNANAEFEEFSYRISSELSAPVMTATSLLKTAETNVKEKRLDDSIENMHAAHKSLSKLETLIQNILSLTQIRNNNEEDSEIYIEQEIDAAIEKFNTIENFNRLGIKKNIQIKKAIKANKKRFSLVIDNTISNAIKYQDTNKETSFLKILVFQKQNNAVIEIKDNGLGIPKEKQSTLFSMFERFHPDVSFGSGLGMYMINESVKKLGGSITFKDTGDGSSFTISIPVQAKQPLRPENSEQT